MKNSNNCTKLIIFFIYHVNLWQSYIDTDSECHNLYFFSFSCAALVSCYRPQTKFAKVMFLHLPVILFTGRGVSRPRSWGVCLPRGCPGPGPGGLPIGGVQAQAQERMCIPACTEADTSHRLTTIAADGTHPTGMHSCS